MSFFDKKEEVMKIEMTPYGRYLLSIGKLKPHSYKFFDENIVYDSNAIGVNENQNTSHERVTSETPLLKCNPNITGVQTNIIKFDSESVAMKHVRQLISDDHLSTNNESIGTCAYETKNNAAITIDLFEGNLIPDQISSTYSSQHIDNAQIPQIPVNMFISASIHPDIESVASFDQRSVRYGDGTGIFLDIKEPIIRFKESNGFDEKDNFTLTAYRVLSSSSGYTYKKLKIPKFESRIVGDLLLDPAESPNILDDAEGSIDYDEDDLLFYINIDVDRQIPDEEICSKVKDYELENIFLDDEIICPDSIDDAAYDIYGSLVRPEDLEDCD